MKKINRQRRYATASVVALIALLYTSINVFAVYNQVLVDYSPPLVYFGGSFGYTIVPSGINVSGCNAVTTPVGLSTEYQAFIESGGSYNFKYCDYQYHSYGSHQDYNGAYRDSVITSVPLYPDSLYLYRSYLGDASGHFYSDWCPSGCYNLEDVVLPGAAGMPYLVTGVNRYSVMYIGALSTLNTPTSPSLVIRILAIIIVTSVSTITMWALMSVHVTIPRRTIFNIRGNRCGRFPFASYHPSVLV